MTETMVDEQKRVVLTPHPLQRIGAFALCALGGGDDPDHLTPEQFDAAVERMTRDAINAAVVTDTAAENGFWLKASLAFFPNSKMNLPSRLSKSDLRGEVARWRQMPSAETWPRAVCALCRRQAVGFYGKVDVPLAESVSYRNTTPRGHGGLALCWPCLCSFYALPYGCVLTGGPSSVMHSLDEGLLRHMVFRQVRANQRHIELGQPVKKRAFSREGIALLRLREYDQALRDGVDLIIFSNSNREQSLSTHRLDQPVAEWLRQTMRPSQQTGFSAVVKAHRHGKTSGIDALAYNAFRDPERIVATIASYLSRLAEDGAVPSDAGDLAGVCRRFVEKVLGMNKEDIEQIEKLAANLATMIAADTVRGKLTGLLRAAKKAGLLMALLQTMSTQWLLSPPEGANGPLMTTRQFRLLFDPDRGQAWLYRQLLAIAVLQELSNRGWRPEDAKEVSEELDDDVRAIAELDERALGGWDGEQE